MKSKILSCCNIDSLMMLAAVVWFISVLTALIG